MAAGGGPSRAQFVLDYDKWEKIEASDDEGEEEKPAQPLLGSTKPAAQVEADDAMYERYRGFFKEHLKAEVPLALRKLLARFIAVQHRGVEKSNIYRYADILGLVTQRQPELMDREGVKALCELHKRMVNAMNSAELSSGAKQPDLQPIMDAINTLEAIHRHPPANTLFEALCRPRSSDRAMDLYEQYERREFGKRAMMRHIFGEQTFAEFEREEAADKRGAAGSDFLGIDREVWLLLLGVCVACGTLVLMVYGLWQWGHSSRLGRRDAQYSPQGEPSVPMPSSAVEGAASDWLDQDPEF